MKFGASRLLAGSLATAALLGLLVLWPRAEVKHATAYFPRTVGLYEGSDVRVLGVRIGKVTIVEPQGTQVRVDFEYDAINKIPTDAKTAIVTPSVVSDRYLQLLPVYRSGPTLADGATIPLDRTAVPVELDRVFESLNQLTTALGPKGANKNGALSRLLRTSAKNLDGQGAAMHKTLQTLSKAVAALAEGRQDTFGTVKNLSLLTRSLAENDAQVRGFTRSLAAVSGQLAGERQEMSAALKNLAIALAEVKSFVAGNKQLLTADLQQLSDLAGVFAKNKRPVAETLAVVPTGMSNLHLLFNPTFGTADVRAVSDQGNDPMLFLCSLLRAADAGFDCGQLGGLG